MAGDSQRAWGYKRAAKAVLRIDRDITPLVTANTFKAISGHRPDHRPHRARAHSRRAVARFVERAVRESGKEQEIAQAAQLAAAFSEPRRGQGDRVAEGDAVAREVSRRLSDALDLE